MTDSLLRRLRPSQVRELITVLIIIAIIVFFATQIDNYLNFTALLALNLRLTRHLHARLGLSLGHDQSHFITNEDPGQPAQENGKIDPRDPAQLNPLYRSVIDTPGRRLRVQEATIFDVVASLSGMF